jgi:hypothetical protein
MKVTYTDREVGRFATVRVIADDRDAALREARSKLAPTTKVVDIAQVTPLSGDEWLVELMVKRGGNR